MSLGIRTHCSNPVRRRLHTLQKGPNVPQGLPGGSGDASCDWRARVSLGQEKAGKRDTGPQGRPNRAIAGSRDVDAAGYPSRGRPCLRLDSDQGPSLAKASRTVTTVVEDHTRRSQVAHPVGPDAIPSGPESRLVARAAQARRVPVQIACWRDSGANIGGVAAQGNPRAGARGLESS